MFEDFKGCRPHLRALLLVTILCVALVTQRTWGTNVIVKLRAMRLLLTINLATAFPHVPFRPEIAKGKPYK